MTDTDTTPRRNGRAPRAETPQGAIGLPLFSGHLRLDPNSKLTGLQAIRTYRDMAWNEPAARSLLTTTANLLRTDLTAAPAGDSDPDKAAAEHCQAALDGMNVPIGTAIRQAYSMLWAGWAILEIVLKPGERDTVVWDGWEYRRQDSLSKWLTGPDGRIVGWEQRPAPDYKLRQIPASRYLHVVADDSEGSPEGMSALRGMYRPWIMTRNLEMFLGIALERFGTGLPVFEVDAAVGQLTEKDTATLQAIGASLRQNEEAYLILPPGVNFKFAESPGVDANTYLEVIRYLRLVMLSTVLADFIGLGTQNSGAGAYSLSQDKSELFLLALNGWQARVVDALNRQVVAPLYRLPRNRQTRFGTIAKPPRVMLPPVKRYDLEKLGGFLQVLNSVGAWTPTAEDEAYLRTISDLLDRTPAQIRAAREQPEPQPPRPPSAAPGAPEPEEVEPAPDTAPDAEDEDAADAEEGADDER